MFDLKEHLKELVEAHAPSGYEGPLRTILRERWAGLVDTFEQDRLGSLIGIKHATNPPENGTRRKIMLAAHMDEIGLMVRDVVDGFIFVHRVSGIDNRVMMAQPVRVHGRKSLPGIVATIPPHLLDADSRKRYPDFEDLVIDVGLPADEVAELVRVGDIITLDVPLLNFEGDLVAGKAMDDRACLAAVTAALHHLRNFQHTWDVYAVATVQEESGLKGAQASAQMIQPDIAIALDVTFSNQPGTGSTETYDLGSGVMLAIGANIHPKLLDQLVQTAKQNEIKYQMEPLPANTGTDAWAIQIAQDGVPTALISIAIRNMHSPVETVNMKDIERAGRLLALFIGNLDANFLETIRWDDLKALDSTK